MIKADSAQRDSSTIKRLRLFALCCGLALVLWLLSSPVQQIYWAASAQLQEVKGALRNSEDFTGDHCLQHHCFWTRSDAQVCVLATFSRNRVMQPEVCFVQASRF